MILAKASATGLLFLSLAASNKVFLKPEFTTGPVTIETTSVPGNLDGNKMNVSANTSSYDYWWFDLVSTEDSSAVNVVFFNDGDIGNPQPLAVELSGVFANGSRFLQQALEPVGASISNNENGIIGNWTGLGASFQGSNLEKPNVQYKLNFNSPALGIKGTVRMKSRAPAHYPCDRNIPGVTELHLERFFWANAVPDADVTVDLSINGTAVKFNGIGYHDKNWGDKTVLKSPKFWDWGHARVGPYSVVWYDLLDYNNVEYHRSYIAKHNKIEVVSCDSSSVQTRPWGSNTTWPPAGGLGSIDGVVSTFALPNHQTLVVNVTKEILTYDKVVYTRAIGPAHATIQETGQTFDGRAFFDEFTYGLVVPGASNE